jgi:Flp pilus assembly pilin Flp
MPMKARWLLAALVDDRAQDTAEYGIALAVIGIVAGLAAIAIATNVGSLWSKANSLVSTAVSQ